MIILTDSREKNSREDITALRSFWLLVRSFCMGLAIPCVLKNMKFSEEKYLSHIPRLQALSNSWHFLLA